MIPPPVTEATILMDCKAMLRQVLDTPEKPEKFNGGV